MGDVKKALECYEAALKVTQLICKSRLKAKTNSRYY